MKASRSAPAIFVLAALAFSGCLARSALVRREPVDDGSGAPAPGGRVRYKLSSARWVMDAERADASRRMRAECEGPFDVVREWDSTDAVVHGLFWSQMYVHHYVEFRCTPMDEIVAKVMAGLEPPAPPPEEEPIVATLATDELAAWQAAEPLPAPAHSRARRGAR